MIIQYYVDLYIMAIQQAAPKSIGRLWMSSGAMIPSKNVRRIAPVPKENRHATTSSIRQDRLMICLLISIGGGRPGYWRMMVPAAKGWKNCEKLQELPGIRLKREVGMKYKRSFWILTTTVRVGLYAFFTFTIDNTKAFYFEARLFRSGNDWR